MLRIKGTVCVDASVDRVWALMSEIERIDHWVPAIRSAHCEGSQTRGGGAVRVCELDGFTVREEFVEWDEGRSFMYVGTGAPLVARATNRWSIAPLGPQTLVTSEAEVVVKGGALGRLLEPFVWLGIRFGLPNSLAPLKYYLETGRRFEGRATDLPPVPAVC